MLDLPRLQRMHLSARPRVQRLLGWAVLTPNYELPPRVRIDTEGLERLPEGPVFYAMNHTDRYNYWPFQYALWRRVQRYTATWVKGKYYQHPFVAKFMELTNNIPTVSRGYVISRDFVSTVGRPPSDAEYKALRGWVEGSKATPEDVPAAVLERPRDLLGRFFDPARETYAEAVNNLVRTMMRRFVDLNREAFDKGLDVLVFPQGTRSKRVSRGHIGLAQLALAFQRTIVPVGCSGSDISYPGSSPFARGGHIIYRVGAPITPDEMRDFQPPTRFEPFSPEAESAHRERFQGLIDVVMERINALVDPPYQRADSGESDGVQGVSRFV